MQAPPAQATGPVQVAPVEPALVAPVPAPTPENVAPAPPPSVAPPPPPPALEVAAPQVVASPEQPAPPAEPQVASERRRCVLGSFCLGPVVTFGVLDVFGIGAQARMDYWGIAFDYQFFHFSTQGIPISLSLMTVEARVYPFAGSFFLAGGLAWQHASLSGTVSYTYQGTQFTAQAAGRVSVPVFKLGLGWMGRSGFVAGIDLALGIQLGNNKVEFTTDLPQIPEVIAEENKIRNRADAWVRNLPFLLQLNLLRLGFLF